MSNQDECWSLFRLSDRRQFDDLNLETIEFFYEALPKAVHTDFLMWRDGFQGWQPLSDLAQILGHLDEKTDAMIPNPPPVPEAVLKMADEITQSRRVNSFGEIPNESGSIKLQVSDGSLSLRGKTVSIRKTAKGKSKTKGSATQSGVHAEPVKDNVMDLRVLTLPDEQTLSLAIDSQAAVEDRNTTRYQHKFKAIIHSTNGHIETYTTDVSVSGFRLQDPLPSGLPRFFHIELDLGPEGKIDLVCSAVRERDGRALHRVRIQVNNHLNLLKSALMRAA